MAGFGGFYKGEKRKLSKAQQAKLAKKIGIGKSWELPRVEIISKKKNK